MKPLLIYCYDAYCGWCYGFSPVILKISKEFKSELDSDTLSGGMILPDKPVHIGATASFISKAYKVVEERTGVKFGSDYLWHINNPDESDWYPDSTKPAVALVIFKEFFPERSVEFASDLQYALHFEGRDLTDNEAYRHLLEKYELDPIAFYEKLKSDEYKEKAQYEFALCKQLQITGYPTVLMQMDELKFYLVSQGYEDEITIRQRIVSILKTKG